MKTYRLNRLFNPVSKRCIDVAVDHGFFNELSFLSGIEDLAKAVDVLVEANPDAIQLTVGQAELLQRIPGKSKPALVLRTDVANVYGKDLPRVLVQPNDRTPGGTGDPARRSLRRREPLPYPRSARGYRSVHSEHPETEAGMRSYNIPLMIEPLVFRPNTEAGGYMVDGDITKILPLVRQAVELGADVIKADPTDDPQEYHKVIQVARVPVLVRGGGKADDLEVLKRTEQVIAQGAAGIVYGRNIIQHANPAGMTKALLAIVHDGATAERGGRSS